MVLFRALSQKNMTEASMLCKNWYMYLLILGRKYLKPRPQNSILVHVPLRRFFSKFPTNIPTFLYGSPTSPGFVCFTFYPMMQKFKLRLKKQVHFSCNNFVCCFCQIGHPKRSIILPKNLVMYLFTWSD